jgi:excisionase family DNA binding protein
MSREGSLRREVRNDLPDLAELVATTPAEDLPALAGRLREAELLIDLRLRRLTSEQPVAAAQAASSRLLDMAAVSQILGVAEEHARELGRRGELPTIRLGRHVRIRPEDLDAFVAQRRTPVASSRFLTCSRRWRAAPATHARVAGQDSGSHDGAGTLPHFPEK